MIKVEKLFNEVGKFNAPYGMVVGHGLLNDGEYRLFYRDIGDNNHLSKRIGFNIESIIPLEYTNLSTSAQVQLIKNEFFLIDMDDQTFTAAFHLKSKNLPQEYNYFLNCKKNYIGSRKLYHFNDHEWQDIRPFYESIDDLEYSIKRLTESELLYFFGKQVLKTGGKEYKKHIFDPMVMKEYINSFFESEEIKTCEKMGLIRNSYKKVA